jgi:hypothetical protein
MWKMWLHSPQTVHSEPNRNETHHLQNEHGWRTEWTDTADVTLPIWVVLLINGSVSTPLCDSLPMLDGDFHGDVAVIPGD